MFVREGLLRDVLLATHSQYGFALASEAFYKAAFLLGVPPSFEVDLALTRAEVCKVAYTHYMDLGNAKRELGYRPVITAEAAVERTAAWCRPQINSLQSRIAAAMLRLLAVILFCCALLYFVTVALN